MGFREGVHYDIAPDPNPPVMMGTQDDWCVILRAPYDGLVGRFRDIAILDRGRRLNYTFEVIYRPEGMEMQSDYDDYIKEVLIAILKDSQNRGTLLYSAKDPE